MKALLHVGLAVAIVLAPALCCCQAGWFAKPAQVAHAAAPAVPVTLPPVESCCLKAKKTCCDQSANTQHHSQPSEKPPAPECACCAERPDAAPPEGKLAETAPQPTGELLSLALAGLLAGFPEHAGSCTPRDPDGRRDARHAALFERHVLRC